MKKALALLLFAFSFCFALNFNEQINDEAHIFSQNERDELLNLLKTGALKSYLLRSLEATN